MEYDELELDTLGDQKTALFVILSDTDSTFNFVAALMYSQLFNLLCDKADDFYGGRLPVHVRLILDEFANIGQIPNFDKLIATIRSREISASIILQSQSQLKTMKKPTYKGKELLPLSVIDAARDGDSQAVDQVLRYYEGYINKLCTRTLYDPDGQPHVRVDEYMKRRLEIKLIHSIVSMS